MLLLYIISVAIIGYAIVQLIERPDPCPKCGTRMQAWDERKDFCPTCPTR